jgi:hypothetical protein
VKRVLLDENLPRLEDLRPLTVQIVEALDRVTAGQICYVDPIGPR